MSDIPTIFLDRDGVINQEPGPIVVPEQFVFIPQSVEAIRLINDQGWRSIIITNQAALAKNEMSPENFQKICDKMYAGFQEYDAYVDDFFYCPHFPTYQQGYIAELCFPCECRKPNPKMLQDAITKHHVNLNKSVFIGDTSTDFKAGQQVGITTIGVKTGHAGRDGKTDSVPHYWAENLYQAIQMLIQQQWFSA